jgi:hypothetical protein
MLSYDESLKILKETNALLEGHFVLSSGLHSEKYIQCAKLLSFPSKAEIICSSLCQKIDFLSDTLKHFLKDCFELVLLFTFFVLLSFLKERKTYILPGVLFGLFICLSLDVTLLISPQSETLMFEITPLTIIGGTVGHIVYGLTLGLLGNFFYKKERFSFFFLFPVL